jgi:hypothetical protein
MFKLIASRVADIAMQSSPVPGGAREQDHFEKGDTVKLKPGAEVEVTIEADANATEPKETSKTILREKTENKRK